MAREKELAIKERKLELREGELRRSFGADYSGFKGFKRAPTPVDQYVTISQTPGISRSNSPHPTPRRQSTTNILEPNKELRKENKNLKHELKSMKRLVHSTTPHLPTPRTVHTSIKLREIVESVPKFNENNISVTQFARCCKRALNSFPSDFTNETETNLTRLLISKLSGHAYVVVENLKIN
ncbi:hypothetical protein M0802_010643 [Mischocyttarus mexicanus]|nr:hypothetical protein M0802_010643 [Mischocyttarus mexicanus]